MCYLTIKEMANISEDVIIVTSRFVQRRGLVDFEYHLSADSDKVGNAGLCNCVII